MQRRLFWILLGLVAIAAVVAVRLLPVPGRQDQFGQLMSVGAGYLESGDPTNAIAAYQKAEKLAPESIDVHLNLANAYLLAGNSKAVVTECQTALNLDHNSAAAYYLMGCAHARLNQAEAAVQAFQQSQRIDPAVTALNFQLGMAQESLGQLPEAINTFETMLQFEPEHPSAHYQLSRLYQRAGRTEEAAHELQKHQEVLAKNPRPPAGPRAFEICKYTQPRIAFELEQPDRRGVSVHFVQTTAAAFGQRAADYHG